MESNITGVSLRDLVPISDGLGSSSEIYRSEWFKGEPPVQWNSVASLPGVLRGVHCHVKHDDFITVTQGELILGLVDIRKESPTHKISELHYCPAQTSMIKIPTGVAHGFYFEEFTITTYAVTQYWSTEDELGCKWDDPDIEINWPCTNPILSERDATASSFAAMCDAIEKAYV